jgi:hypothetical protein
MEDFEPVENGRIHIIRPYKLRKSQRQSEPRLPRESTNFMRFDVAGNKLMNFAYTIAGVLFTTIGSTGYSVEGCDIRISAVHASGPDHDRILGVHIPTEDLETGVSLLPFPNCRTEIRSSKVHRFVCEPQSAFQLFDPYSPCRLRSKSSPKAY